jgi:hypothetical protein
MKINFFEYKKNCEEFKILIKSTSEFATRTDLKKGRQLFKSIYTNIIALNLKLNEIENSITNRHLENLGTVEKKVLGLRKFKIEYEPNLEQRLYADREFDPENYYLYIQPRINQIVKFLDSDFDYEVHIKETFELEKKVKEGKADYFIKLNLEDNKFPIEESIKIVLEYYSEKSFMFMKYLYLFLNNE